MKLNYFPETDTLYIELADRPSAGSDEVADGVVIDLDAAGRVVGIEVEHASERAELRSLVTERLPLGGGAVG